ncbi:helix-turn-helix domain-containing protein [Empedobacter falsenii]|uniref:helix-turn-helix domain-containing protein n=1 Tax=Empedobacter falsenii TaxID=343874 RepID=UPI003A810C5A
MEEQTKEIISFLEAEMHKQGLKRENLADKINVNPSQIKRMFELTSKISFDLVVKVALALNVKELKFSRTPGKLDEV